MTGIYIHIPFCKSKCPYCDFYSFKADEMTKDSYLTAVLFYLEKYAEKITAEVDTVYFGGGTPSFFGGERIKEVLTYIKDKYSVSEDAEITVECNPSSVDEMLVKSLSEAGVNRISMGMQSAVDKERVTLGRLSDREKISGCIKLFRQYGIENISLDLMLGIPYQTKESLKESIDFVRSENVSHVSAYMLKIEENTEFHRLGDKLLLPDEDEVCELYLHAVDELRKCGYIQYEISNFSKEGFESRHNLRYWHCEEYLGIGPSAHSFLGGKRFYFERDFESFIKGTSPTPDGDGGDSEEYVMLALRLTEGLQKEKYKKRFGRDIDPELIKRAHTLEKEGLVTVKDDRIVLTVKGFLVSNSVISYLLN
ncbi:MAG: radical SAM family heme chaperone HemW [Clostridia bacterium]|nr:radical SAM family heme chaperone HemW [Clostridia bacterium]